MTIPTKMGEAQFEELKADSVRSAALFDQFAEIVGLSDARYFDSGSVLVGGNSERVLKIFPPGEENFAANERDALRAIDGRLASVRTSELLQEYTIEGWSVIEMRRVTGVPLADVWGGLPPRNRRSICRQIGSFLSELHRCEASLPSALVWDTFLAGQKEEAVKRQRDLGWDKHWTDQIADFLARLDLSSSKKCFLHTEIMRVHLFVEKKADGDYVFAGAIDFEPAMNGDFRYEFASVGLFVTRGDRSLFAEVLTGYGFGGDRERLASQIMGFAILHRYANFPWYFKTLTPDETSIGALAQSWFGSDLGD